jgi:hypothetical protein
VFLVVNPVIRGAGAHPAPLRSAAGCGFKLCTTTHADQGTQAKHEKQLSYLCHYLCDVSGSEKQLLSSPQSPGDSNAGR